VRLDIATRAKGAIKQGLGRVIIPVGVCDPIAWLMQPFISKLDLPDEPCLSFP
jgi:hypothetical protein